MFLDTSGLQEALDRCEELLSNSVNEVTLSSWHSRMGQVSENWAGIRSQIVETLIAMEGNPGSCHLCQKVAVIRCNDCSMRGFCAECDVDAHDKMPLHDRQFFNPLGCFQPIPPTVGSNTDGTSLVLISKCLGVRCFLLIFFNRENRVIFFRDETILIIIFYPFFNFVVPYLGLVFTKSVNINFCMFLMVPVTRNILGYSLF